MDFGGSKLWKVAKGWWQVGGIEQWKIGAARSGIQIAASGSHVIAFSFLHDSDSPSHPTPIPTTRSTSHGSLIATYPPPPSARSNTPGPVCVQACCARGLPCVGLQNRQHAPGTQSLSSIHQRRSIPMSNVLLTLMLWRSSTDPRFTTFLMS